MVTETTGETSRQHFRVKIYPTISRRPSSAFASSSSEARPSRSPLIQDGAVIRRILGHLGLPDAVPEMRPSRAPPLPFDSSDDRVSKDDY